MEPMFSRAGGGLCPALDACAASGEETATEVVDPLTQLKNKNPSATPLLAKAAGCLRAAIGTMNGRIQQIVPAI